MWKKKRKKVEEKGGHFTAGKEVEEVRGSKIVTNHVNQLRSCSKSATDTTVRVISSRADSHLCAESLGPQPGRRHGPTAASFLVASFIPRCSVITWPPRDRFQPISGSDNRNFLRSLEFSIRRTCSNRMRVPSTIWANLLVFFLNTEYTEVEVLSSKRIGSVVEC